MKRPELCTVEGIPITSNIDEWIAYADSLEAEIAQLKARETGFLTSLATLEAENVALRKVYKAVINRSPDTWVSVSIVNAAEEARKVLEDK